MSSHPVILLEFNELSPVLMNRFMKAGALPHFADLHRESEVHVTECEERPPYLEPWIQWITVHSGLSYQQHKVFNLGDGKQLRERCLWDVLSDAGRKVWVCGSMNVRYDQPLNGLLLPDPWTTQIQPWPAGEFDDYLRFVQKNVVEYTNDDVPLKALDYLKFVAFMATHGMSQETVMTTLRQLAGERAGRARKWKRAVILDKLQFDIFRWYYKKHRPDFSTFFLNSTAHFQHLYWRNMEPEVFTLKPPAEDQAEFQHAILFGYQQMDRLVGRFLELAPEATLVFCTGLSQQPCLKYEEEGGKVAYRPRDFDRLLAFAGVDKPYTVSAVMAEEFFVHTQNERDAAAAETALKALRVDSAEGVHEVMKVRRDSTSLFCGCKIFAGIPRQASLTGDGDRRAGFYDVFYQVEGMKSGMHHPDGMLWIRTPARKHQVHAGKLPLTSVAPMILDMFGLGRRRPLPSGRTSPRERRRFFTPSTFSSMGTASNRTCDQWSGIADVHLDRPRQEEVDRSELGP